MKINIYAIADTALNSDSLAGYTFNVVMSHTDGKKTILGAYNVFTDDEITGTVFYKYNGDISTLNGVKKIILSNGLEDIVAGAEDPRKYFWNDHITFPRGSNTSGAFQRAEEFYNSDRVIKITNKDYVTMMEYSEKLDTMPEIEADPFDGIDFDGESTRR